jgi:hypothetical protein
MHQKLKTPSRATGLHAWWTIGKQETRNSRIIKQKETDRHISQTTVSDVVFVYNSDKVEEYLGQTRRTTRKRKFLCVGGPLDGQKKIFEDFQDKYKIYSCAYKASGYCKSVALFIDLTKE